MRSHTRALASAAIRELGWGLRAVSREVGLWRAHAERIPDATLRCEALHSLDHKRGHTNGAAFFWTLPDSRNPTLLRTLVAYEVLLDYLDSVSEREAVFGPWTGRRLYGAAADALDPGRVLGDYYRPGGPSHDAGYLAALVDTCRHGCRVLPSHDAVKPLLVLETRRSLVLGLNHEPSPTHRVNLLRSWAATELPQLPSFRWYELTAAASGWLTTHVLIALAAEPTMTRELAERVHASYFPWVGLAVTMLDSYVDQDEDAREGAHSYISHYPSNEVAHARLCESIQRATRGVAGLPNSERHAVLLACMVALYLSKDSARTSATKATTTRIAAAAGPLPRLLLPVLRTWRLCNAQSSST